MVKGTRFLDLRDAGDPVEVAARYDAEGADELVFLDITASHEERDILIDIVRRTAEQCFMPLTVGGGIRTIDDIRRLLQAGADKVSINSAAVKDPDFVRRAAERFGNQCIVVAIDPKRDCGMRIADCGLNGNGIGDGRVLVLFLIRNPQSSIRNGSGGATSTAAGCPPTRRPSRGPARPSAWGPARSS